MEFKVQWFPGHMTKAKRMMEDQLRLVDVVVELLDARCPLSSSNPLLARLSGAKPRVIALSKVDMADSRETEKWLSYFERSGRKVYSVDCVSGKGTKALVAAVAEAAQPVITKWRSRGMRARAVRVMIVGVPNVGKSTLINRLAGRTRAVAADRPGVTRGQQWISIGKSLELLDTPGVLWPKFDEPRTGLVLALTGAIREEVYDRTQAVQGLMELLAERYPELLTHTYGINIGPHAEPVEILEAIGRERGCLKAGGVIDRDKVIQLLLRDFKAGTLGRITLDEAPNIN